MIDSLAVQNEAMSLSSVLELFTAERSGCAIKVSSIRGCRLGFHR